MNVPWMNKKEEWVQEPKKTFPKIKKPFLFFAVGVVVLVGAWFLLQWFAFAPPWQEPLTPAQRRELELKRQEQELSALRIKMNLATPTPEQIVKQEEELQVLKTELNVTSPTAQKIQKQEKELEQLRKGLP